MSELDTFNLYLSSIKIRDIAKFYSNKTQLLCKMNNFRPNTIKKNLEIGHYSWKSIRYFCNTNLKVEFKIADCSTWAVRGLRERNGFTASRTWRRSFSASPCPSTTRCCTKTRQRYEVLYSLSLSLSINYDGRLAGASCKKIFMVSAHGRCLCMFLFGLGIIDHLL